MLNNNNHTKANNRKKLSQTKIRDRRWTWAITWFNHKGPTSMGKKQNWCIMVQELQRSLYTNRILFGPFNITTSRIPKFHSISPTYFDLPLIVITWMRPHYCNIPIRKCSYVYIALKRAHYQQENYHNIHTKHTNNHP